MNINELNKRIEDNIKKIEKASVLIAHRVSNKCGEIIDASNLYIGLNGEPNGFIIGKKGRSVVETIVAGGYNIQILHYRVLVK